MLLRVVKKAEKNLWRNKWPKQNGQKSKIWKNPKKPKNRKHRKWLPLWVKLKMRKRVRKSKKKFIGKNQQKLKFVQQALRVTNFAKKVGLHARQAPEVRISN